MRGYVSSLPSAQSRVIHIFGTFLNSKGYSCLSLILFPPFALSLSFSHLLTPHCQDHNSTYWESSSLCGVWHESNGLNRWQCNREGRKEWSWEKAKWETGIFCSLLLVSIVTSEINVLTQYPRYVLNVSMNLREEVTEITQSASSSSFSSYFPSKNREVNHLRGQSSETLTQGANC